MTVKKIENTTAYEFIDKHHFELMLNRLEYYNGEGNYYKFWKDKYIYYGVFDSNKLVAIQIVVPNFDGWSYEKNKISGSCRLVVLQKISGTKHGVFKTVLDYFEPLYKNKYIYLEVYVDKLKKMYESLGFEKVFKNNEHMYKKFIY